MVQKCANNVVDVSNLSTLGASFLEEIHCGYSDGQLGVFREHEGWRREAEGTEESKEAPRQDELQVIHPFCLSLSISLALHPLRGTEDKTVPGLFL